MIDRFPKEKRFIDLSILMNIKERGKEIIVHLHLLFLAFFLLNGSRNM